MSIGPNLSHISSMAPAVSVTRSSGQGYADLKAALAAMPKQLSPQTQAYVLKQARAGAYDGIRQAHTSLFDQKATVRSTPAEFHQSMAQMISPRTARAPEPMVHHAFSDRPTPMDQSLARRMNTPGARAAHAQSQAMGNPSFDRVMGMVAQSSASVDARASESKAAAPSKTSSILKAGLFSVASMAVRVLTHTVLAAAVIAVVVGIACTGIGGLILGGIAMSMAQSGDTGMFTGIHDGINSAAKFFSDPLQAIADKALDKAGVDESMWRSSDF